jgi:ABC-2 type transport system permease protein
MMLAVRVLSAEIGKLNRSLVLLLAAAPPLMMAMMGTAVIASGNGPETWLQSAMGGAAIWGYLLMPLTVTALTALVASLEHQSGGWTWTLAQPAPKWLVFAAKAVLCVGLTAVISLGVGTGILAGGMIGGAITPDHALAGDIPLAETSRLLAGMMVAGLLLIAIQFTVAHAFRTFAIPIIAGIGGTFVAVVATSSRAGLYFPWLLPVNMLATDPAHTIQALWTGGIGGLIVFTAACLWLARRDWR